MRRVRSIVSAVVTLSIAALGACATGRGGGEGDGTPMREEVSVRVENDLTTPGPVTVFAVAAATGARVPLGTVPASSTGEVRFRSGAITGGYVLEAQRAGGGASLRSQRITLTGGESLTWNLRTNAILVNR